jgi:predicted signal transduction protein with EAL and GGDEF domain
MHNGRKDRRVVCGGAIRAAGMCTLFEWHTALPMLEGILGLAAKLSLPVIAECIEAPEQLQLLRTLGCPMGQGYLLGRPVPAHTIQALLAAGGLLQITESTTPASRPQPPANLGTRPERDQTAITGTP